MIDTSYTSLQQSDDFGLTFSNKIFSARLASSTDTTLAVPLSSPRFKAVVRVSSGADVFISLNKVAGIPGGASFAVGSEIINEQGIFCREVKAGDVLHFFSANTDSDVTVAFYKIIGS